MTIMSITDVKKIMEKSAVMFGIQLVINSNANTEPEFKGEKHGNRKKMGSR